MQPPLNDLPDDLLAPLGRRGRAEEIKLHPHALRLMVADRSESPRWETPRQPTDTIGFDIGRHRLGWRVFQEGPPSEDGTPTATGERRSGIGLILVLDGVAIGSVTPSLLTNPEFHQSPNNPVVKLWNLDADSRPSAATRRVPSTIPGRTRESKVRCYDLRWGAERWLMAMVEFPRIFGLWRTGPTETPEAADDSKTIAGDPIATYARRGLKRVPHLAWAAEARLLDVIICATRGFHGDFTHLASTRAQRAYSIAADLSF